MRKKSFILHIWDAVWPLFIYMAAQNIVTMLGIFVLMIISSIQTADGSGRVDFTALSSHVMELYYEYAIVFILIAALLCIPIYYKMYRKDKQRAGEKKKNIPITNKDIGAIALSGAALALALNSVISVTPLPHLFQGYEDTNEVLFGGGIVLQILSAGIFACIVEEISLRGITYLRMKRCWGKRAAMIFSAVVFGVYHLNVVQAVYAFFLGLFFAWLYERYDSLWAPCIGHMSANLFVIMLSESVVFEHVMSSMVGYCLTTCISLLVFYYGWRYMKQTDPLVELQFVEKEPDTLEGLREEYKKQDREEEQQ